MEKILETAWTFLNSPIGIMAVVAIVMFAGAKLYAYKPSWRKYEGTIISAIKYAESAIPDDTDNKAVAKFDAALQYVLKIHREVENRAAKPKEVAVLSEGIRILHSSLETDGTLDK